MKTLVLGLGNPILSDDSVGFRVVQELKASFDKQRRKRRVKERPKQGSPQKRSFCGVKILSYITNSPSPYQGEGDKVLACFGKDKGDRVTKQSHKPDLTLVESSASGLSLLDLIAGYDKLIIIDAIKTEGGEAGKIYRLSAENLGAIRHSASPHDVDLATALELGRKLGMALPQQIIIFAIEVVDVTTFSEKCTPEVEKAIPVAVSMVTEELDRG